MLHFHRAALRAEHQLTDLVVPTQPVVVHDVTSGHVVHLSRGFPSKDGGGRGPCRHSAITRSSHVAEPRSRSDDDVTSGHVTQPVVVHDTDDEACVANAFVRHGEGERFVEDWVESLLMYPRTDWVQHSGTRVF